MHHISWDEVHLYAAVITFCRRDTLTVESNGVELGAHAAHNDIAGFTLIVLHGYTGYTLDGVSDIGIREAADLVSADNIGDIIRVSLLVQCFSLSFTTVAHYKDSFQCIITCMQRGCQFHRFGVVLKLQCEALITDISYGDPVFSLRYVQEGCNAFMA